MRRSTRKSINHHRKTYWVRSDCGPLGPVYEYELPGIPIPLLRARHYQRKVYDSQKAEKNISAIWLDNQHDERPLLVGPLKLSATFYFEPPRSNKKLYQLMLNCYHQYTPDLSNLVKYIEDVGKGIIYRDDCLIAELHVTKKYAVQAKTVFTVQQFMENHEEKD